MAEFYLTNKAVEDLNSIWNYTFDKWSEKQADKYSQMLIDTCQKLADYPNLGKQYEFVKSGLFGFLTNRTVV